MATTEPSPLSLSVLQAAQGELSRRIDHRINELRKLIEQGAPAEAILALDQRIQELAARLDEICPDDHGDPRVYRPAPTPRFWSLEGRERAEAIGRLELWVEEVFRPQFGTLAARLAPCWTAHPLALVTVDVLAELWSVLWLNKRTTPLLVSQSEFLIRHVQGLADLLAREFSSCPHSPARISGTGSR